ncbi:MAG: type II toxin-antitoxin system RelE/ParE family toxin [Candidatus Puniceispirillales bacterium WSBS_2018_MAG_OTU23]
MNIIKSFKCKDTEKIWKGLGSRSFPTNIQDRALIKLRLLDAAQTLDDLTIPSGNRLKSLGGNRIGQMSIRINDQWRICFVWGNTEAQDVEIIDYHWVLKTLGE